MQTETLSLQFNGRKKLSPFRRRTLYIYGVLLILIGLIGMYKSTAEINQFVYILIAVGILKVIQGVFGKKLIKENNSITISTKEIEYKNSFQESTKIALNDLLDIRIDSAKVEFVVKDQSIESYDFSTFQKQELDTIYTALQKLKAALAH